MVLLLLVLLLGWASPAGADIVTNLVGYWAMDAGSPATTLVDSSGSGITLTFGPTTQAPTWITPGQVGAAATSYASASNQYAQVSVTTASPLWPGTSNFTVMAWVKRASTATDHGICGTWNQTGRFWYLRILSSGNGNWLRFAATADQNVFVDSTTAFTDTASWHHVAVSVTRGGTAAFYLDGVAAGTPSVSALTGSINHASPQFFCIGCMGDVNATFAMNGSLDEVRVYVGRALSQSDVQEAMNFTGATRRTSRPLFLD